MTNETTDAPSANDDKIVLPLSKPIMAHAKEVDRIEIRKPVGRDLLTVGNPVLINFDTNPPSVSHDWKTMPAMLSQLAQLPMSSIAQLDPKDLVAAAWIITDFFVPSEA